ncbi:MAG TPA: carboxylesterase family protein [Steroidobacteraceae bacterium]|nr:carboxylesterase family protein [Steroidobacteraceae bacterium]
MNENGLTVLTRRGALAGLELSGAVAVFRGIRYAEPPVGELRWKPPVAAAAWSGVRRAADFGPACLQTPSPPGSIYAHLPPRMSEDCLFLNVWQPHEAAAAPVMVWLHGGALRRGDPAEGLHDGRQLARKGVVVVTVNYRLGVLGYFAHPRLSEESPHDSSGNYGLLDQIEALRWVRDNIAAFGGDPGNVTLFGESAGALSAIELMSSPLAGGLFHRVILQSGYLVSNPELKRVRFGQPSAESAGERLARELGASDLAALRAMPAESLVRKSAAAGFDPQATIDGWALPRQIVECLDQGAQSAVPMIVGFNEGETRSLRSYFLPPLPASAADYESRVRSTYRDLAPSYLARYPAHDMEESVLAAARDAFYGWSAERLAGAQTRLGLPAYLYFFAHSYPAQKALRLEAFHASELPYEFGRIGAPDGWPELWPRPPDDAHERALSEAIMSYFTSFARDGVPVASAAPLWRPYREERAYLEFGDAPRAAQHLLPGMFELHEEVIARRRAAGTQHWYLNVGLASPPVP